MRNRFGPFPPHLPAGLRERGPILLPIARDARKQAGMHRHAFMAAQHHAAPIHDADLAHGLARPYRAAAFVQK